MLEIREFEYSPEAQESRKEELEKLVHDQENLKSSLLQWSYASYAEVATFSKCNCKKMHVSLPLIEFLTILQVFISWMHFSAVRVFAESILRYGLPPSFLVNILHLLPGFCLSFPLLTDLTELILSMIL